jgi:hypothetical protein
MKNSKRSYPLEIRVSYFKDGVDTRDNFNEWYVISKIVNNTNEEQEFYEGLNHEANIVIDRI